MCKVNMPNSRSISSDLFSYLPVILAIKNPLFCRCISCVAWCEVSHRNFAGKYLDDFFVEGRAFVSPKKTSPPKKKTSEIPGHGIIAPPQKKKIRQKIHGVLLLNMFCCSYCWWKRCCTTWDVWNPVNNGINYQPQLVGRISCLQSVFRFLR